jgi:protein-tyrosine phosphatase
VVGEPWPVSQLIAARSTGWPYYPDWVERMWIDLDGLANLRDVGGIPTSDGDKIIPGRLLRSDNLQTLTASDVDQLLGLGLTDVIDLRSDYEAQREGRGPLASSEVRIHQFSLFREWEFGVGEAKPDVRPEVLPEEALPWIDLEPSVELDNQVASVYFSYLVDRPDSVVAALRAVAGAPGVALVHCAAGKDRTGTIVALALSVADAERQAIIDDYAASSERVEQVVARLTASPTYAGNLQGRPISSHLSHPEAMISFLRYIDETFGGVLPMLTKMGWTAGDTELLRAKLRG